MMRTWVRMPNWLGDLVAVLPVLDALVERGDDVTLALPRAHAGWVAERIPSARIQPLQGNARSSDAAGHDLALLFDGSWRSARAAWGAGVARRIGWARGGRGPLLTTAITPAREIGGLPIGLGRIGRRPRWLPRPFGSAAVELAGYAGIPVAHRVPELRPSAEVQAAVRSRSTDLGIDPAAPFVLANVGARPDSAKGWPPESWRRLLKIVKESAPVLLTCGPGEEDATSALAREVGASAYVSPPASVMELAALGELARVCVATDGGARHVLRAGGARTVTLIGPTDPRHTAEHLVGDVRIRETVPCGPCHLELCPIAGSGHHLCMTSLSISDVAQAVHAGLTG